MKNNMFAASFLLSLFVLVLTVSCATEAGDDVDCPTCDNETELLVGSKCVPIEDVEPTPCGPDGHSHGDECHCFSGQEPTEINGTEFCLQQGCPGEDGDADGDAVKEDLDMHACEHLGDTPEEVEAVASFADFENAHVDLEHLAHVELPAGSEGFVHFPGDETGEVAVFIDTTGVIDGFLNADEEALEAQNQGENSDCPDRFKEVWHVEITNDSGSPKPQIIRFKADVAEHVELLILEIGGEHEEH